MLSILGNVTISCFFTSYLVVLVLELLRLVGRIPGRGLLVIVMMVVGLFTHACYLILRASEGPNFEGLIFEGLTRDAGLWASWTDWSLLLAFGLAVCFFIFHVRRPDTVVSFFFLPAVMAMIALGMLVRDRPPFSRSEATEVWRSIHALAMMLGSAAVLVGFLAGMMYLVQSRRLKNHRAGSAFRLPTLETLGRVNRRSLIFSTVSVGIGVIAGVIMNLNRWGQIGWTDGGVLLSSLLLAWLIAATLLEHLYAPAKQGRKAVYLTLASLGFLVLAMFGVLSTEHGQAQPVESSFLSREAAEALSLGRQPQEKGQKIGRATKGRQQVGELGNSVAPSGLTTILHLQPWGSRPRLHAIVPSARNQTIASAFATEETHL